jgi:hypothetical protein
MLMLISLFGLLDSWGEEFVTKFVLIAFAG